MGKAEFFLIRTALQMRSPAEIVTVAELAVALNLKKLLLILHFISHERLASWTRHEINAWTEFLEKEPRFSLGYARGVKVTVSLNFSICRDQLSSFNGFCLCLDLPTEELFSWIEIRFFALHSTQYESWVKNSQNYKNLNGA